jgi:hypothetical protein
LTQISLDLTGGVAPDLGLVLSEWFNSPFFGRTPEDSQSDFLAVSINRIPCKRLTSPLLEHHFKYQSISISDEYLIASTGLPNPFQVVDNWINNGTDTTARLSINGKQWTEKSPIEILDFIIHRQLLDDLQGLIPSSPTDHIPPDAKLLADEIVMSALLPTTDGKILRTSLIGDQPDGVYVRPYLFPALQQRLAEACSIFPASFDQQFIPVNFAIGSVFSKGVRTKFRIRITLAIIRAVLSLPKLLVYRLHAWRGPNRSLDTWRLSESSLSRTKWKQLKHRGSI